MFVMCACIERPMSAEMTGPKNYITAFMLQLIVVHLRKYPRLTFSVAGQRNLCQKCCYYYYFVKNNNQNNQNTGIKAEEAKYERCLPVTDDPCR